MKTTPTSTNALITGDKNKVLTPIEKNISDQIFNRIKSLQVEGGISFPVNYSYANALKSAWLILQNVEDKEHRKALDVCKKESIANSLLDMIIQGLSPSKKQCYFVAYGKELVLMRSYMGTIAVTKRLKGIKDVFANCIYEDDKFKYKFNLDTGLKEIIQHDQEFDNIDPKKITGAYAIIIRDELPPFVEIMNIDQIKKAWMQGAAKGNSPAHQNFPDEMAKKTVINRACKIFFNTSDDSDLLIEAINRTTETEQSATEDVEEEVKGEIAQNANSQEIDIKQEEKNPEPQNGNGKKESQDLFADKQAAASGPGY